MSDHDHSISPVPLLAVFALIIITVVGVAVVQWNKRGVPVAAPAGQVLEQRELRFEDASDGRVLVIDAQTETLVDALDVGTNGFLRAMLRGLARDRRAVSVGPEVPFRIARYDTGRILLIDPVTDRRVDLLAFGSTNAQVFSRYLAVTPASAGIVQEALK